MSPRTGFNTLLLTMLLSLAAGLTGCQRDDGNSAAQGQPEAAAEDSPASRAQPPAADSRRPNILLIVADDLGYTDLGAFGGEINTPNLDRLALAGTRLTNFHTSASCAPTRAMLLTGTDNHIAGMGSQSGLATEQQKAHRAYRNALLPEVPTVAEHLRDSGYRTLAVAKWHLGREPESLPGARGFDRSFVLLEGGGGHFDDTPLFEHYGQATWLLDDAPASLPDDFYSSDAMTDQLMAFVDESDEAPFFAYLGFTAPHWPLQAPAETIALYEERYAAGWDDLRARRMAGAIARGVVGAQAKAVDFEAGMLDWSSLSARERESWAKRMTVYAAMVHRLDENVGRLLSHLEKSDKLDNTVVVFIADNGAEAHDMEARANRDGWLEDNFDNSVASIGTRRSYTTLGAGWARATAAPFRASKSKVSEGGIRVPAFFLLPDAARGSVDGSYMRVMDLAPTFLEIAGAPPRSDMLGRSLLPRWMGGEPAYDAEETVAFEVYGRRGAQRGDWKVLLQEPPFGTSEWQLYNLATDQGEQHDLSARHPEIRDQLIADWEGYAREVGVVLPETPIPY